MGINSNNNLWGWNKLFLKYSNNKYDPQIPPVATVYSPHSPRYLPKWLLVYPFVSRGKIENYSFPIIQFYLLKWIHWIFSVITLMIFRNGICNLIRYLKFSRPLSCLNETENVSINRIFCPSLIISINWEKMEIQLQSKDCVLFHIS